MAHAVLPTSLPLVNAFKEESGVVTGIASHLLGIPTMNLALKPGSRLEELEDNDLLRGG